MFSSGRLLFPLLSVSALSALAGSLACSSSSSDASATDGAALSGGAPIVSSIGHRCLDDVDDGTANGNKIDIYTCNGTAAQSWSLTGGTFVGPGGKCLGVSGGVQTSGTVVDLYPCNGSSGQQWTVAGSTIKSAGGLCLDVRSGTNANGTQVQIYTCNGTAAQSWNVSTRAADAGAPQTDAGGGGGTSSTCGKESTPADGSPTIFNVTSPVAPGETALLFGGHVGTGATVMGAPLADSAPGLPPGSAPCLPTSAVALDVLQTSSTAAKAVIPASWSAGIYAVVVSNGSGPGAPVLVNRPRLDWVHGGPGGALVSGGTFEVYGRNLGTQPSAWLTSASGTITALTRTTAAVGPGETSDGYVETFALPSLASGSYTLHVHNGHGGPYGFSDGLAVTVAAAVAWPTTVYEVAANTGNDDAAFASALASAANGGIIEFASGSYRLTHGVVIPQKTVVRSATGNRADVTITFDEAVSPFPYGFAGDANFTVQSITVTSSTSARLFQCPDGPDFLRDPVSGGPQYQPDAPCENVKLHDVDFTLTTLRDRDGTGDPTYTDLAVINGTDCEISDSSLVNKGGGALALAKGERFYLLRNTLSSGTTCVSPFASEPLSASEGGVGGDSIFYFMRHSAIAGNTAGPAPGTGAGGTMGIEYDAHDLYIADNTFANNLTDYGEGFSFDAPYYPSFVGTPSSSGATSVTFPTVKNVAGNSVFQGPLDGKWAAATTAQVASNDITLVGESLVVVNGTGLGQYAEIVANAATAADGTTEVTLDRAFAVPLDKTSVVAITVMKSQVVFARNTFGNVGVGAQLYAGGYDFLIDGTKGESVEGTYCLANDFMSARASASDLQRRFSTCFFNQWIHTAMTNKVDSDYPWWISSADGLTRPYTSGFIGVHFGVGETVLPAARGLGAVGNIFRDNQVQDFSYGLVYSGGGSAALPSPLPTLGQDNLLENDTTTSVPTGIVIESSYPDTLVRNSSCTSGCTTSVSDPSP